MYLLKLQDIDKAWKDLEQAEKDFQDWILSQLRKYEKCVLNDNVWKMFQFWHMLANLSFVEMLININNNA